MKGIIALTAGIFMMLTVSSSTFSVAPSVLMPRLDVPLSDSLWNTPARFKLDYIHTTGYSTKDRYWYEVMLLDSLVFFQFSSPNNDDWNKISYQKQMVLDATSLQQIKTLVLEAQITQEKEGYAIPLGSGYGAQRLMIACADVVVAGSAAYIAVGTIESDEEYAARIRKEKEENTTLGGNYEAVFDALDSHFVELEWLKKSMNITR